MAPVTVSSTFPRVDIFMQIQENRPFFDVDNAEEKVPLQYDSELKPIPPVLNNAQYIDLERQYDCFQSGDNIEVLSFGLKLPLSFELLDLDNGNINALTLSYYLPGSAKFDQTSQRRLFLFSENYEMALGSFLKLTSPLEVFTLAFDLLGIDDLVLTNVPHVSMYGVPDYLNGKRFFVSSFIKVRHTLPLVRVPLVLPA